MSSISTYKKQLQIADRRLTSDQENLFNIEREIEELQKKRETFYDQIERDSQNVVTKGMLYYNSQKRDELFRKASQLSYSQLKIDKLRSLDDAHWNADNVTLETIHELEALEAYIGDNSPGFLSSVGSFICGGSDS